MDYVLIKFLKGRKKIVQLIQLIDFLLSAASVNDQLSQIDFFGG